MWSGWADIIATLRRMKRPDLARIVAKDLKKRPHLEGYFHAVGQQALKDLEVVGVYDYSVDNFLRSTLRLHRNPASPRDVKVIGVKYWFTDKTTLDDPSKLVVEFQAADGETMSVAYRVKPSNMTVPNLIGLVKKMIPQAQAKLAAPKARVEVAMKTIVLASKKQQVIAEMLKAGRPDLANKIANEVKAEAKFEFEPGKLYSIENDEYVFAGGGKIKVLYDPNQLNLPGFKGKYKGKLDKVQKSDFVFYDHSGDIEKFTHEYIEDALSAKQVHKLDKTDDAWKWMDWDLVTEQAIQEETYTILDDAGEPEGEESFFMPYWMAEGEYGWMIDLASYIGEDLIKTKWLIESGGSYGRLRGSGDIELYSTGDGDQEKELSLEGDWAHSVLTSKALQAFMKRKNPSVDWFPDYVYPSIAWGLVWTIDSDELRDKLQEIKEEDEERYSLIYAEAAGWRITDDSYRSFQDAMDDLLGDEAEASVKRRQVRASDWLPGLIPELPRNLVSTVSKAIDYGIGEAGAFAVALLEDVNAHDEAKQVNNYLLGKWRKWFDSSDKWLPHAVELMKDPITKKLLSEVSNKIKWDISVAEAFAVALLEDVNAHSEAKAVNDMLLRSWPEASVKGSAKIKNLIAEMNKAKRPDIAREIKKIIAAGSPTDVIEQGLTEIEGFVRSIRANLKHIGQRPDLADRIKMHVQEMLPKGAKIPDKLFSATMGDSPLMKILWGVQQLQGGPQASADTAVAESPEDDDAFIVDKPMRGYEVSYEGKHLGNYDDMDEAMEDLVKQMDRDQVWSNIWFIDDHGGESLIKWKKRGRKIEYTWSSTHAATAGAKKLPGDNVLDGKDASKTYVSFLKKAASKLGEPGDIKVERDGAYMRLKAAGIRVFNRHDDERFEGSVWVEVMDDNDEIYTVQSYKPHEFTADKIVRLIKSQWSIS